MDRSTFLCSGEDEAGGISDFDGVAVYYANKFLITDGSGRIQAMDMDAAGGIQMFVPLNKAGTSAIGNTGWSITSCTKSGTDYTIGLSYIAPDGVSFDADIKKNETTSWLSPNIETVIPGCAACPSTAGTAQGLIAGDIDTKVIATIHNLSGVSGKYVRVKFSLGRTNVAGVADLGIKLFADPIVALPAAGTSITTFGLLNLAFIEGASWGATLINALKNGSSHYCIYVDIEPLEAGDANMSNHSAQKNSGFQEITQASPYAPFNYQFYVSNPDNKPRLVLFEAANVPDSWDFQLTPASVLLAAKEEKLIDMQIQVPPNYPPCTNVPIQINSITPMEHTLVPLGGIMAYLKMRKKETLTINTRVAICNNDTLQRKYSSGGKYTQACPIIGW